MYQYVNINLKNLNKKYIFQSISCYKFYKKMAKICRHVHMYFHGIHAHKTISGSIQRCWYAYIPLHTALYSLNFVHSYSCGRLVFLEADSERRLVHRMFTTKRSCRGGGGSRIGQRQKLICD